LNGGAGFDTLSYEHSTTGVTSNFHLGADFDFLAGFEKILGSAFDDHLSGNNRDNTLEGAGGADTLTGGAGSDLFAYSDVPRSTVDAAGRDTIRDFSSAQADKIDLSAIDGSQAFTFTEGGAFTGAGHEVIVVAAGSVSTVLADLDGDRVADFAI